MAVEKFTKRIYGLVGLSVLLVALILYFAIPSPAQREILRQEKDRQEKQAVLDAVTRTAKGIVYIKEPVKGLCFAGIWISGHLRPFTEVSCEKVHDALANG